MRIVALMTLLLGVTTMAMAEDKALQVVPHVDLSRYLGTWYEIATIPQSFQRGCTGVTATYSQLPDGDIRVLNECRKGSLDGRYTSITGKAWVADPTTNAKLKVRFFWPFSAKYWIIELDQSGYQYAVVGHPSRKYLWILSRTPQMADELYRELLQRLRTVHGYDTDKLVRTLQPAK
jgi:apolipoprotein D and lipocalin family protein